MRVTSGKPLLLRLESREKKYDRRTKLESVVKDKRTHGRENFRPGPWCKPCTPAKIRRSRFCSVIPTLTGSGLIKESLMQEK